MLYGRTAGSERRERFQRALHSGRLLRFPGAFSPLVARLIEEQAWDGVYVSGAALAADRGMPDIGLLTLTEVAQRGRQIAAATELPCIVDIDTGFGEPIHVARAVRELEDAGFVGCHLEDQALPKQCGHLSHKALVQTEAMSRKIRAACAARRDSRFAVIARTDARSVDGMAAAIARARAYVAAGATLIFPEALESEHEFEIMRQAVDVPLMANMTEFGRSPLLSAAQLERLGYNVVIYPVTALRLAMAAVEEGLARLREDGSQQQLLGRMQSRERLYELVRYGEYCAFDSQVADFEVPS